MERSSNGINKLILKLKCFVVTDSFKITDILEVQRVHMVNS